MEIESYIQIYGSGDREIKKYRKGEIGIEIMR